MLVAQISDTHILAQGSDHPAAERRADDLRRCIADINGQRPDAVIFTGDTVQHGRPEEYARLRALLAPLEAPLYLIPGNRDDNDALRRAFDDQAYLPKTGDFLHYRASLGELRLIAIDSTSPGERKGVFCPARQAWLDVALSDQPNRPTLLFIHHPPFDVADHYVGGYRRQEDASALAEIVGRHRQVERLLCGHVHCPVERSWAGTMASVMPSIAVDVRKGIDEADAGERPIYQLHHYSHRAGLVSQTRTLDASQ